MYSEYTASGSSEDEDASSGGSGGGAGGACGAGSIAGVLRPGGGESWRPSLLPAAPPHRSVCVCVYEEAEGGAKRRRRLVCVCGAEEEAAEDASPYTCTEGWLARPGDEALWSDLLP